MANGFFGELVQPPPATPVPQPPAQPPVQPQLTPEQHAQATQNWTQVLQDPAVMAGLFQIGMNLTQPSWDTGAAPVFRAIGGGAEAAGRVATQQEEAQAQAAKEAEAAARTDIQRQQLGVTERGNQQQYELGQQQIRAQADRQEREFQLKKELQAMPPNLAELALTTWAKLRANPPLTLLNDPEGLATWEGRQLEDSIAAAKRAGSALAPGAPGASVAPTPAPQGRIKIDAQGNIIPSEVPTQ